MAKISIRIGLITAASNTSNVVLKEAAADLYLRYLHCRLELPMLVKGLSYVTKVMDRHRRAAVKKE